MFSLQQNWRTKGQDRCCLGEGEHKPMYMNVNKCKTDKILKNIKEPVGGQ
jgi:hypothetical protein